MVHGGERVEMGQGCLWQRKWRGGRSHGTKISPFPPPKQTAYERQGSRRQGACNEVFTGKRGLLCEKNLQVLNGGWVLKNHNTNGGTPGQRNTNQTPGRPTCQHGPPGGKKRPRMRPRGGGHGASRQKKKRGRNINPLVHPERAVVSAYRGFYGSCSAQIA